MFNARLTDSLSSNNKPHGQQKVASLAAAFQYTEHKESDVLRNGRGREREREREDRTGSSSPEQSKSPRSPGMNGYTATADPPPALYVRALYSYDADDQTSLSFREGDIIQVLTQLESGWWDGVINDVRGWFPSNYCVVVSGPDDPGEFTSGGPDESDNSAESANEEDEYDEQEEDVDSDGQGHDEGPDMLNGGSNSRDQEEAAFWIPQATPDGRLFYFNTLTGVSKMELPLETPTSVNETGPRDRTNFHVPEQTKPPPEMMARGLENDEEDYDDSASENEGESLMLSSSESLPERSILIGADNTSSTQALKQASPSQNNLRNVYNNSNVTGVLQLMNSQLAPVGTSSTSFAINPGSNLSRPAIPRAFVDDGINNPMTWNSLVENMQQSVDAYREAIKHQERSEFVRKAEDISDHLRMLLAAGSGTTDNHSGNHSGNPSIISTNKALYPHFRDMMSRFSKLVLSSHIAAADWPGPDALAKCLQEADGVLHGVYGYVEVARQQRGEELPRLVPGFVQSSYTGGNWRNNNLSNMQPSMSNSSFIDQDDGEFKPEPSATLDENLIYRIDDARKALVSNIRHLEEQLQLKDKIVTPSKQVLMGEAICGAAGTVLESFRPWVALIELINLAPIRSTFQNPQAPDFSSLKQRAYDNISEIVMSCQAVTAPLADEWAEYRDHSLEDRLNEVKRVSRLLENTVSQISYALPLLIEPAPLTSAAATNKDHRMTDPGEMYHRSQSRADDLLDPNRRPLLGDIGQSQSYTMGSTIPTEKFRRPNNTDKTRQFFGVMPPPNIAQGGGAVGAGESVPWFLQLDHQGEVSYDMKFEPPQLKSGTIQGLVEQLTRHDRLDAQFNGTFLLTYRSFTNAAHLFEMLVRRFNLQPPPGLTRDEYALWEEQKQKPVRIRVVNILKTWIENYWMEGNDEASQKLLERCYGFTKSTIANTKTLGSGPLMAVIEQRLKGQDTSVKRLVLTLTNSAPQPILPKNLKKLKFLDIDATEFARQLTIIESKLYGKIKPTECLDKTWQRKPRPDGSDAAPNVKSLILHSNQLTNWVAEMILSHSELKKRVFVIKHFVAIADKCRGMNNYSTLTSIVSALGTAPILRLSRTWAQVNVKTSNLLEAMRQLMASTKNFARYREKLHQANPPCIPFLGVYLTDLTFIEDGIASVVKNTDLINFTKRAKTAEVIRDIQQYQNVPYSLNSVPDLQEWILDHMRAAGDVHEMYDRSLQIEPREREEEKIARLLSESGFL